jgi:hypothetical protein
MASDYTLNLQDDWDLHVNDAGDIEQTDGAQGVAQNVANAFRLFTKDAYYFEERGIPHFLIELRETPRINVLRSRLKQAALAVEGVKDAEIQLMEADEDRALNGIAKLTLYNGENVELYILGL